VTRRPVPFLVAAASVAALALTACGSTGAAAPPPSTAPPATPAWCGASATSHPSKVMVIWEENHSASDILTSSDAPTFRAIARSCASATDYRALTHPSLPNYLAMTSGVSYARSPFNGDCSAGGDCTASAPSVFAQETGAGRSWAAYAQSMTSPCEQSDDGAYAVRHNPATYYPALAGACARQDLPLGSTSAGALVDAVRAGTLPTLSTVTPDVDHDMHDGTIAQADTWLRQWLPVITAGADYRSGRLAVLVVWDEGDGGGDARSSAPLLALSAATRPGTALTGPLDDYSILRTVDDISGLPPLAQAATAPSFAAELGAPASG
jgi:hypothetical protein